MLDLLAMFLNWQFLSTCLAIMAATFVVRRILEYAVLDNPKMPGTKDNRFWTKLFLPLFPVVLGFVDGVFGTVFPENVVSRQEHFFFGAAAGLLAPIVFIVIKGLLWDKIPAQVQTFVGNLGVRKDNTENCDGDTNLIQINVEAPQQATPNQENTPPTI